MSAWTKGFLTEALKSVTNARASPLRVFNGAYASQMYLKTGLLEGRLAFDEFHQVNVEVSQTDTNAAVNIKHRADDTKISVDTISFKVANFI